MAEKIVVKVEPRDSRGKNAARRLRADGKVPVVVYGGDGESVSVAANLADLAAILRSPSGQNTVFSLEIGGGGPTDVIFQDRQIDPIKGRMIHADLRRLVAGEKIELTIPLHFIGEPVGVKEEGGLLVEAMREVTALCDPGNVPNSIDVDVSGLGMNESLHISDITFPEGVEVHEDAGTVVASVTFVKEPELEPQVVEGAQPEVEGEAPAEGAPEGEAGGGEAGPEEKS
jgi:large subunit ribosomal protein L25